MSISARNLAIGVEKGDLAKFVPKGTPRFGRRIGFLGDSIVNGSGASNANLSLTNQIIEQLGSASAAKIGAGSVVSGHPGYRSDQIAPYLQSDIIAANCDVLVTLQGTNDTGQWGGLDSAGRTIGIATYSANMLAQFKAAKLAGMALYVLTIPPRGSNASPTATQLAAIDLCNAWLRLVVPQYGTLVEIHQPLANNTGTTDFYVGTYDSGDGVHPSSLGHWVIAKTVAAAMKSTAARSLLLDGLGNINLVSNQYLIANSTGWFEQPGGTGTAPTYANVADTTSFLVTGNWREMDFDGTSSGGSRTLATALGSGWSVGDTLAVTAKAQLVDVSGDWQSKGPGVAGTAGCSLKVTNQSGVSISGGPTPQTGLGYPIGSSTYNFGPCWETFVVPAATTALNLWFTLNLPTGSHYKMHVGEVGVINLTTSGLASAALNL